MQKVNIKMLQKSILCGFRGITNFFIGAIVASNGAVIRSAVPGGGSGPQKKREGLYAMYNNFVPTLEVLVCMGVICVLLERLAFKKAITNPWARVATAVVICMALMMLICTLLRVLDRRRDCCADYDYDQSFNRMGGYGMHFNIPGHVESRNMLCKLVPGMRLSRFFAFDRHVPEPEEHSCPVVTPGEKALHCLGALLSVPFWVAMLALNIIELPIAVIIDSLALCTRNGREYPFGGSRDVVCQAIYSFYQLIEPVTCVLPEGMQRGIGAGFGAVVRRVLGMPGEGRRTGEREPGCQLESAEVLQEAEGRCSSCA
ncbi:hypothetical protein [Neorickettsia sennetsu]|nr:hypothetical protein [Neorickettsia sennetsu]